ncbi:hypothetical protein L2E82_48436 [Cichorium intybus]|uniref:Uncharacterized protein n=1 Tax=Cichorium intybus TaxID=13427 RepID=A0ACB8YY89_CICIN|nr:hypothetical protein L2E82_48436 [Cichorium intybus]
MFDSGDEVAFDRERTEARSASGIRSPWKADEDGNEMVFWVVSHSLIASIRQVFVSSPNGQKYLSSLHQSIEDSSKYLKGISLSLLIIISTDACLELRTGFPFVN